MTDRRRINGPPGGTTPPVFGLSLTHAPDLRRPERARAPSQPRKIFLKTGLTPSASGSAYFELEAPTPSTSPRSSKSLIPSTSSIKLTCTVHGPRPQPRSAAYSPQLVLSTHVKFAPFATRFRRGYVRDASERDLGAHLETALRGVIIGDRWPKSGVDVIVTVLEGEEDFWWGEDSGKDVSNGLQRVGSCGLLTVLAGCITVASAALVDAGIDCVDLVSGGVAALVKERDSVLGTEMEVDNGNRAPEQSLLVLDPCPAEHETIMAACVVGYLASRDELTEIWMKGIPGHQIDELIEGAVAAATITRGVLAGAVLEGLENKMLVGHRKRDLS